MKDLETNDHPGQALLGFYDMIGTGLALISLNLHDLLLDIHGWHWKSWIARGFIWMAAGISANLDKLWNSKST